MSEKTPPYSDTTPPPPPFASPSRSETSSSITKVDPGNLELGIRSSPLVHPPAGGPPGASPRANWLQRLRMAYSRRASRRPDSPTLPEFASPSPHSLGAPFSEYDYPPAGSSKKVRLEIDTSPHPPAHPDAYSTTFSPNAPQRAGPGSTSPRAPFPPSQSATSTDESSQDPKEPSMLILLREDYFSIRTFWRTANRRDMLRKLTARSMWKWYLIIAIAAVLSALLAIKHDQIVHWLHPIARDIRHWPAGFMIPIVMLVIVSFPPLVGHEIIGILIGLVWDLGKGFAILAAGTFIGEIALWISFKWCCQARAAKFEKKNKLYSSLTTLIREKTFAFVLILRFSAVPGHITTAVSASAGANFWLYLLAAALTLPKQFAIVYLGSAFGTKSTKNTLISTGVMVITIIGTVVAAGYIYYQMRLVMRRKAVLIPVAVVPMGDQPTWGDVANAEEIARRQSQRTHHHLAGHNQKVVIISPDGHVASPISLNPEVLRIRDTERVFPTSNTRGHTPTRAWSVPHRMSPEEYKEFIMTKERLSPRLEPEGGDVMPDLLKWQESFNSSNSPPTHAHARGNLSRDDNSSSSATLLGSPSPAINPFGADEPQDPLYPPPSSPHMNRSYSGRGTMSLDLTRTSSNPTMGGRQVADDADLYAYVRGGRRPDYARLRGESGAALLGRPRRGSMESEDPPPTDSDRTL